MSSGKFNHTDFDEIILQQCGMKRKEVHCGPGFGIDVSVVKLTDGMALAMTSDPLTLIPSFGLQESAWLSVHLMANDMATTGFSPMYAQMVLNLSPTLSRQDFNQYWGFVHQYCKDIGVSITGGHTGSIEGQNSTIAGGGTMVLTAPASQILLSKYAKAGNLILLTKECAISSTAILSMSFPQTVINKAGKEAYDNACSLFYQTSSLSEALLVSEDQNGAVTAMHDVTEGGVLGAVFEMAIASGNGIEIHHQDIPISDTTQQICELFGLDPRFCIGAGSMVMAVDPIHAEDLLIKLRNQNIPATIIGKFTDQKEGYKLLDHGRTIDFPYFDTDPYWAAYSNSLLKGWK